MADGWHRTTLADLCGADGLQTGPFGGQLHKSDYTDDGVPVIMPKDMMGGRISDESIARVPSEKANALSKHKCRPGDILFGRRGDIGRAALITHDEAGWLCGTGSLRARPANGADPDFLIYALTSGPSVGWLTEHAVGQTMLNLNTTILGRLPVGLPPLPEQRKIAAILSSVDEAIEATRAVIDQVQVVKKGLMQELLTKGIPGRHTKFKDTEIGRIPETWEVVELATVCRKITDGTHQAVKPAERGEIPFLYVSCIRDGDILWDKAKRLMRSDYDGISKGREPCDHLVLYTAVGSYGHAAVAPPDKKYTFQRHIAYLQTEQERLSPEFLATWLNSTAGRMWADGVAVGNAQKTVTLKAIKKLPFPLPSLSEQEEICSTDDTLSSRVRHERELLGQFRRLKQALMSVLLTGELRVQPEPAP